MKWLPLILIVLVGCNKELTMEEKWVKEQDQRCKAASGRGTYSFDLKDYECWQKPAFRRPKLVFKERYLH